MKKSKWDKRIYSLILLCFMMVAASIFSFSGTRIYAAVGDPTITVTSPTGNQPASNVTISLSGAYTDTNVSSTNDLIFTAYDKATETDPNTAMSTSTANPDDWVITGDGTSGTWAFSKKLPTGTHIITIEIKEKNDVSKIGTTSELIFTISRPYVTQIAAVVSGSPDQVGEDLTYVPQNAQIRFTITSTNEMSQLVNKINNKTFNPFQMQLMPITQGGTATDVTGDASINDLGLQSGKYVYEITFTPNPELQLNKTYLAYLKSDPNLSDDVNNPIFAKFIKFTTRTNAPWDDSDNPHGHYQMNTNTCSICHSSHVGSNNSLDGGSYQLTFNEQLTQTASKNYCMACHDGTTNAPAIDKISSQYHHNNPADYDTKNQNNLKDAVSCTSCHNPHLEWTEQNQNLLKDHFVYTHNQTDIGKQIGTEEPFTADTLKVDSLDQTCDACHGSNEINLSAPSSGYEQFLYKKSTSVVGSITTTDGKTTVLDYSLCLRCHNADKKSKDPTIADIETYYIDPNSGHNFTLTGAQTNQADGSTLNGPFPCAECHETHGSNNIKMLRENLGNLLITDPAKKFISSGKVWNGANERAFCKTCHNNSTEIYGKTGTFKLTDLNAIPINGHQAVDDQEQVPCSTCHGGTSQSFLEAAHDPKIVSQ